MIVPISVLVSVVLVCIIVDRRIGEELKGYLKVPVVIDVIVPVDLVIEKG